MELGSKGGSEGQARSSCKLRPETGIDELEPKKVPSCAGRTRDWAGSSRVQQRWQRGLHRRLLT